MNVGVAKASIVPAALDSHEVHDPLMARTLVVASGGAPVGLIVSLDLTNLDAFLTAGLVRGLARSLGLAEHKIIVHVTHTHSAPRQNRLDRDKLAQCVRRTAQAALRRAVPARMAFIRVRAGREFSRNRRWDSRSKMGTFTIIDNSGCEFRDGEVYVRGYVEAELAALGHRVRIADDARLDSPVDEDLSLLHFVDARGRSIGGVARFAAHVDQVALRHGMVLSAEYPGYLCRRLDRKLGGAFLFLNGPSGDIKPYYQEYTWDACRRTGEGLADRLIEHIPARGRYRALETVDFYADRIHLSPRQDIDTKLAPLVRQIFELRQKERNLAGLPVKAARELSERRWTVDTMAYVAATDHGGDTSRLFAPWPFPLEVVSFNRAAHYLCLPDEVFSEMTRRVRAACPKLRNLQTVSLCNGASWYLPPEDEIAKGGYEPTWSVYAPDAFDAAARAAIAIANRAQSDGRRVWTADLLARQLAEAGVRRGDVLMVHSAIRSCGYVEGGADGIIRALVQAVGAEGTVVFPTFTGARENHPDHPPAFDRRRDSCWTGALPRRALAWPGAVRSFHPTHSCVAIGPAADELTRDHFFSVTPIDARSPIRKVAERGGKILIVGLDLRCLTLVHSVEEVVRNPDPCFDRPCRCLMIDGDRREPRDYYLHDWSVPPIHYERYRPHLARAGAIRPLRFADSACWLLSADKALAAIDRALRKWRGVPSA